MELTLQREANTPGGTKAYGVYLDGNRIGMIDQAMVSHDRKPAGSRAVTSRTSSLRWFAPPSNRWTNTRWEAVATVVARQLGGHLDDYEDAARAARVQNNA